MTLDTMLAIKDREIAALKAKIYALEHDRRLQAACAAMQGELASQSEATGEYLTDEKHAEMLARRSTLFGDRLLAELDRTANTKGDET